MKNKGFTLIELLIVISILGILMSVSLVAVTSSQKQARDTQRRSDLGQYRLALESYAASNSGKYPGYVATTAIEAATTLYANLTNFMASSIIDPKDGVSVCFNGSSLCRYYYRENSAAAGATATEYLLYGGLETGGYWEICSNGKSGKVGAVPADSVCDL